MNNISRKAYHARLKALRLELVEAQTRIRAEGLRVCVLVEGRDAAGKDGVIRRLTRHVSPRTFHVVALGKPTPEERTSWYFKRYVAHLPAASEVVLFNRSWYNRAVVEPVMGFCSQEETDAFLEDAPRFERMITRDGLILIKIWLEISRDEQARRLEARRSNPLKQWKVSSVDEAAQQRWDAFTAARDIMMRQTDHAEGPWTVIDADCKRSARLRVFETVLKRLSQI